MCSTPRASTTASGWMPPCGTRTSVTSSPSAATDEVRSGRSIAAAAARRTRPASFIKRSYKRVSDRCGSTLRLVPANLRLVPANPESRIPNPESQSSRVRRERRGCAMAALFGNALEVPALAEGGERIRRQAVRAAPVDDRGPDVGRKRILQVRFGGHQIAAALRVRERGMIDERRLREQLLRDGDGLDHRLDLAFEIVALIDHVRDVGPRARLPLEASNLVEDAEHLIRIDRSERQVVVALAPIVEVA